MTTKPRRIRTIDIAILGILAILLLAPAVVHLVSRRPGAAPSPAPPARAEAAAYRRRAEDLQAQITTRDGVIGRLQAALRARSEARPRQVVIYDTVVRPDTVILGLTVDRRGTAAVVAGARIPDGDTIGYQPSERTLDVGRCDDGIVLQGEHLVCDRARAGHLVAWIGAGVASSPVWGAGVPPPITAHVAAGLRWTPAYRSLWSAELRVEGDRRSVAEVRRGIQLW